MMTTKQEDAVKTLQKAFVKCQKAGIAVVGVDRTLWAVDKTELNKNGFDEDALPALNASDAQSITTGDSIYLGGAF